MRGDEQYDLRAAIVFTRIRIARAAEVMQNLVVRRSVAGGCRVGRQEERRKKTNNNVLQKTQKPGYGLYIHVYIYIVKIIQNIYTPKKFLIALYLQNSVTPSLPHVGIGPIQKFNYYQENIVSKELYEQ